MGYFTDIQDKLDRIYKETGLRVEKEFVEVESPSLKDEVKELILNNIEGYDKEEVKDFFDKGYYDINSGTIKELIYTNNVEMFAVRHYSEIMETIIDEVGENGIELSKLSNLTNLTQIAVSLVAPTLQDEILNEMDKKEQEHKNSNEIDQL